MEACRQGLRTRCNPLSGRLFGAKLGLHTVVGQVAEGYNRRFAILPTHPVYDSSIGCSLEVRPCDSVFWIGSARLSPTPN